MASNHEQLVEEAKKIFDDVKKFTSGFLGLKKQDDELPIKIHLLDDKTFTEKAKETGTNSVESFMDFNCNIYMNVDQLKDDFYRERIVCILSYFYPSAFVLEETNYGKSLKKYRRLTSYYLPGIGKAVELSATKVVPGYVLKEFEKKVLKDMEFIKKEQPIAYEAFDFCKILEDEVKKFRGDMNPEAWNRVLKASLLAAGRDEYFDMNFKRLMYMHMDELYELAGATVARPDKTLGDVVSIATELKNLVLDRRQWRDIKPLMEDLGNKLRAKGLNLTLRNTYETQLKNCEIMESLEPFKKDMVDTTRELLEEVVNECKKCMDRPIKIIFY